MKRAGVVLCGGLSSRMGRPKAWLPWFGRPMVAHVVEILRPLVDEVVVVTSAELELPPLPARVVVDRERERGPLAGIRDGLAAAGADSAFVTSTDSPFLSEAYVTSMFERGGAVAPIAEGRVQVLSAVYPGVAAGIANDLLAAGKGRPRDLLEALDYEAIELELEGPPPWRGFNTPAEYLDCARKVDPMASAEVELLGRAAMDADPERFEVPIGTLGEVLAGVHAALPLVEGDRVAKGHLVSLGGRFLVRDLGLPIGPGEQLTVIDSQAGG
jgi:molybdopterin-guanine dinucleotide biosynthesis protein A